MVSALCNAWRLSRTEVIREIDAGNVTNGDVSGALLYAAFGGDSIRTIFTTDPDSHYERETPINGMMSRNVKGAQSAAQLRSMSKLQVLDDASALVSESLAEEMELLRNGS